MIKRHLKVFLAMASMALKRYLEHRWNTLGTLVSSMASLSLLLLFIEIIFSKTNMVNGWSKPEIFFFTGVFQIFSALFSLFVLRGINYLPNYIQKGSLDVLLTKPVNLQFFVTFRLFRAYEIINLLPGLFVIWYSLNLLRGSFGFLNWALLFLGIIAGLGILYGIYFSLSTLSFWLVRFNALTSLYGVLTTPLAFPVDIFGKGIATFLTFIIPLGFMLTVPVQIFFGKTSLILLSVGWIFAILSVGFSIWFWNFALKHYTSASS